MKMTRWEKVKVLWDVLWAPREMQKVAEVQGTVHAANPYLEDKEADAVYETLEHGLHAVWPLLNVNGYGGTLAARGVVWGALYTFTMNEDGTDQRGIAWELANLVRDYLPEDQDPDQLPGVRAGEDEDEDLFGRLTKEQKPGVHRIDGELAAFMDAALSGNFEGAARVTDALRTRLGAIVESKYETPEDARKTMAVNFLGSCLASVSAMYGELVIEEAGTRD